MSSRRQSSRPLALLAMVACCVLVVVPGTAPGQQRGEDGALYAETPEDLDGLRWERDRELLHRGNPLAIEGLEQGDNAIRGGTPALVRTDGKVAMVDLDELYRRKLAMYDDGARFHAPVASSIVSAEVARSGGSSPEVRPPEPGEKPSDSISITGLLALIFFGLLFAVVLRLRQQLS